ncbi:MAG TPA: hypothetical protein VJV75_03765 [Candidatus Polarisedimenticolia bacterium]|nr:hypothetical protein [Candidatus Polarisedimenticolia bacterium]
MALEVRSTVAAMRTNREARALLGVAADYLHQAFELVPELTDLGDVQDQARDLLERTNLYATGIYAMIRDDDQPISEDMRPRVQTALLQAQTNLRLVAEVRAELEIDYLEELVSIVPAGAAALAKAATSAALDHWPATIAAVVVALLAWHFLVRPMMGGARS